MKAGTKSLVANGWLEKLCFIKVTPAPCPQTHLYFGRQSPSVLIPGPCGPPSPQGCSEAPGDSLRVISEPSTLFYPLLDGRATIVPGGYVTDLRGCLTIFAGLLLESRSLSLLLCQTWCWVLLVPFQVILYGHAS